MDVLELKSATPLAALELKSADNAGDDNGAGENAGVELVTKALDGLRSTVDERFSALESKTADITKLADRVGKLETKLNRPTVTKGDADEQPKIETKAFTIFIRKGREALAADEIKSLRVADDSAGGYLAPEQFVAEIDKNIVQFSPVRSAARVGSTASGSVTLPKRTGRPTAKWVDELETRPATESAYGQVAIVINEMAAYVDVSNKLLEDSAVNIANEVAFDLAEEFGRLEGEAFVLGDGNKKPLGLMSDPGLAFTASGNATSFGVDSLIDIFYALKPFYRQRGVWLMNGKTIAATRKLEFTGGGNVWQPSLALGQPETIMGRPVVECVDMPDVAAGEFPILFGDFASGFRIYDRVAFSLLRDPYSQATSGLTRFHARRRVGAAVTRAEAVRKLKIATA